MCGIAPLLGGEVKLMKRCMLSSFICTLIMVLVAGYVSAQTEYSEAFAVKVNNIVIDGDLSEWPADIAWYPITNCGEPFGPTDLTNKDLNISTDLSPSFAVGFNTDKNLLYVAVRVRDDMLTIGTDPLRTDACEVYVRSRPGGEKQPGNVPAQRYVMCPPGGLYWNVVSASGKSSNPALENGNIADTATECVCVRADDMTVYEWAIEVFDTFPGTPAKLGSGMTVDFDVVVVDKDSKFDASAVATWAKFGMKKSLQPELLGDLLLIEGYGTISVVAETLRERGAFSRIPVIGALAKLFPEPRGPVPGVRVSVSVGDKVKSNATTGEDGHFAVLLPAGTYDLTGIGAGVYGTLTNVVVTADNKTDISFLLEPVTMPDILKKSLARYASLTGYSDQTTNLARQESSREVRQDEKKLVFRVRTPQPVSHRSRSQYPRCRSLDSE